MLLFKAMDDEYIHHCDECDVDLTINNHLPGCSVDEVEYDDNQSSP